jgi:hypothetical protein
MLRPHLWTSPKCPTTLGLIDIGGSTIRQTEFVLMAPGQKGAPQKSREKMLIVLWCYMNYMKDTKALDGFGLLVLAFSGGY